MIEASIAEEAANFLDRRSHVTYLWKKANEALMKNKAYKAAVPREYLDPAENGDLSNPPITFTHNGSTFRVSRGESADYHQLAIEEVSLEGRTSRKMVLEDPRKKVGTSSPGIFHYIENEQTTTPRIQDSNNRTASESIERLLKALSTGEPAYARLLKSISGGPRRQASPSRT